MMSQKEKALAIVDEYSLYHAGTAIAVGAMGGQFGADTVALTALTISMIESICNVYGIHDRKAKNIHIATAIARLTYKGTVLAKTILNWIPMGCLANGATSYFLTRNAGLKCIQEIERGKMNVKGQLVQGLKDISVTVVSSQLGNSIENLPEHLSEDFVENIKETLNSDVSMDLGTDSLISCIENIPTEAMAGIDKAIGISLRAAVIKCLQGGAKTNTSEMMSKVILGALVSMIDEHTKMSESEVNFRIMLKDKHYKTFETFLKNTASRFDEIEKERSKYEAVKYCLTEMCDCCKVYFGLDSKSILNSILDNPYDKAIEIEYNHYLSLISESDNLDSILAKSSMLYYSLIMINFKYNLPNASFEKTDDALIYMISERIRTNSRLLEKEDPQVIAFNLSKFIQKKYKHISTNNYIPFECLDTELLQGEIDKQCKCQVTFWVNIAKVSSEERCVWTDCVALYMQLFRLKSLVKEYTFPMYKDDNLIYQIAETIKPQIPLVSKYSTQQIAYFIAEAYDRAMV